MNPSLRRPHRDEAVHEGKSPPTKRPRRFLTEYIAKNRQESSLSDSSSTTCQNATIGTDEEGLPSCSLFVAGVTRGTLETNFVDFVHERVFQVEDASVRVVRCEFLPLSKCLQQTINARLDFATIQDATIVHKALHMNDFGLHIEWWKRRNELPASPPTRRTSDRSHYDRVHRPECTVMIHGFPSRLEWPSRGWTYGWLRKSLRDAIRNALGSHLGSSADINVGVGNIVAESLSVKAYFDFSSPEMAQHAAELQQISFHGHILTISRFENGATSAPSLSSSAQLASLSMRMQSTEAEIAAVVNGKASGANSSGVASNDAHKENRHHAVVEESPCSHRDVVDLTTDAGIIKEADILHSSRGDNGRDSTGTFVNASPRSETDGEATSRSHASERNPSHALLRKCVSFQDPAPAAESGKHAAEAEETCFQHESDLADNALAELTEQNELLKEMLLKEKNNRLASDKEMIKKLARAEEEQRRLMAELEKANRAKSSLEADLEASREEKATLKDEFDNKVEKIKTEAMSNTTSDNGKKLEAAEKKLSAASKTMKFEKNKISRLSASLDKEKQRIKCLQKLLEKEQQKSTRLEQQCADFTSQLEQKEAEVGDLTAERRRLSTSLEKQEERCQNLSTTLQGNNQDCKRMSKLLSEEQELRRQENIEMTKMKKMLKGLEEEKANVALEMKNKCKELGIRNEEIKSLKSQLEDRKKQAQAVSSRKQESALPNSASEESVTLREENRKLQKEKDNLQELLNLANQALTISVIENKERADRLKAALQEEKAKRERAEMLQHQSQVNHVPENDAQYNE
jgi:hypothetical protein